MAKDYLIKGIDPELYREFKSACIWFDLSIKDTLIKHMQNIVSDYKRALSELYKPKIYKKVKGKQ